MTIRKRSRSHSTLYTFPKRSTHGHPPIPQALKVLPNTRIIPQHNWSIDLTCSVYLGQESPQLRFLNLYPHIFCQRSLRRYRGKSALSALALALPSQSFCASNGSFHQIFTRLCSRQDHQHSGDSGLTKALPQ